MYTALFSLSSASCPHNFCYPSYWTEQSKPKLRQKKHDIGYDESSDDEEDKAMIKPKIDLKRQEGRNGRPPLITIPPLPKDESDESDDDDFNPFS